MSISKKSSLANSSKMLDSSVFIDAKTILSVPRSSISLNKDKESFTRIKQNYYLKPELSSLKKEQKESSSLRGVLVRTPSIINKSD